MYEQIMDGVVGWLKTCLAYYSMSNILVVRSNQNAPAPKGAYIVVDYAPNIQELGTGPSVDYSKIATENDAPILTTYKITFTVRELEGDGELLRKITQVSRTNQIMLFLAEKKLSLLTIGQIVKIPSLNDQTWGKESSVEIVMAMAYEISNQTMSVETIDITNQI